MIYIITGVPGSGKSLLAVEWQRAWLDEGRAVYSDIDGLDMSKVAASDVAGDSPRDWRLTPEGSVVVYDEAQGKFPSSGKPGRPSDEIITAMETHRHSGHDLVFISQNSTMIHHHIRKLAGRHTHVQRAFGTNGANLFEWYEATDERDRGERSKADKQLWRYPKKLFEAYQSATVHTHKARIPRKLLALAVVIAVLVAGVLYAWSRVDFGGEAVESAGAVQGGGADGSLSSAGGLSTAASGSGGGDGDSGSAFGRMGVRDSKQRGTDHLGGDVAETMDGAALNHHWRLVAAVHSQETGEGQFLIRGDGRTISVPNPSMGWRVHSYRKGVLHASAPGGPVQITWYTGPRLANEKDDDKPAAMAPRDPVEPGSDESEKLAEVIPESSEWSADGVASWDE